MNKLSKNDYLFYERKAAIDRIKFDDENDTTPVNFVYNAEKINSGIRTDFSCPRNPNNYQNLSFDDYIKIFGV